MTFDPEAGSELKTQRLRAKPVSALSRRERDECDQLTFHDNGEMRYHLRDVEDGNRDGIALLIHGLAGEIIAWALLCDLHGRRIASTSSDATAARQRAFFYVAMEYRRRGLGRRLMAAVIRRAPDAQVKSWDKASEAFFANYTGIENIA